MNKLKFLVSLLLALGLVACPDDEKDDETKITLKFDGLKDFAQGASPAGFKVTINKDDKIDKESKLKVKVEIACDSDKASKESTASEGVANFSASDFSGITWTTLAKDKKCTATATAEGAEKATKEFKVTEGDDSTEETTPELAVSVKANGHVVVSNLPTTGTHKITLDGGNSCTAYLVQWKATGNSTNPWTIDAQQQDDDGFDAKLKDIYLSGNATSCEVAVGDEKADLSDTGDYSPATEIALHATQQDNNLALEYANPMAYSWFVKSTESDQPAGFPKSGDQASAPKDTKPAVANADFLTDSDGWEVWVKHSGGIQKL